MPGSPVEFHSINGYDPKADPSIPKPMREAGPLVTAAHFANSAGGIKDRASLIIAVEVAIAESDCDVTSYVKEPDGTWSDGPWMINSSHGIDRKTLTAQAKDQGGYAWGASARHMGEISKGGTDWGAWTTYPALAAANEAAATQAVDRYIELVGGQPGVDKGGQVPEVKDKGYAVDEGVTPGVRQGVEAAGSAAQDALGAAGHLLGLLTNRALWVRVGLGAAGVALLITGTLVIIRQTKGKP